MTFLKFKNLLPIVLSLAAISFSGYTFANKKLFNTAYVEVNSSDFGNVGKYFYKNKKGHDKPFFDYAAIFAANINADPDTGKAYLFMNDHVSPLLCGSDVGEQGCTDKTPAKVSPKVKDLQKKGVKVLLTVLGNYQNAGWSCFRTESSAKAFAKILVNAVNKYKLDGIDIDDEYSACSSTNLDSMIWVAKAIVKNPKWHKHKRVLTKALFSDIGQFQYRNQKKEKLSDFLNYGWEMTYSSSDAKSRLNPYYSSDSRMKKKKLAVGIELQNGGFYDNEYIGKDEQDGVIKDKDGGVMIYNVQDPEHSTQFLSGVARAEGLNGFHAV
jgi:hypothetical protein